MTAKEAMNTKFDIIPGDELDKYGLTKIRDPFNKCFPVAIVGIGVHMPDADNVPEFQKVLDEGRCVLRPIPSYRWSDTDYYSPDPHEKGRYTITKLGFYDKYFHFDPAYFNMSPRESVYIDTQQRNVLCTTEHALQDAGLDTDNLSKDTGVYIGMGIIDTPGTVSDNRHMYNGHVVNGYAHSCAANRVSHHYGLNGPSCAVDTACAASLTAVHVAIMSMWNKECKMAIAGATSQVYSPECVVAFSQLGVLSATGNCAPFDESNNGYVRSEGTGIVILKNIKDAIKDGDHIYCVIRGTTSAHNGYSMSLTLPSVPAQIELIERCYEQFGIELSRIPYVEAHGTGTPVGDPIEVQALGNTFGKSRPKSKPLRIASAKSNFGHLEVCAGMVQVVKAAIMLEQRRYFKHINWSKPNHRMDLKESNIEMQLQPEYYTKPENMLIGVNTFGFGGSLVHQIFEEVRFKQGECSADCLAGWTFGDSAIHGRKIAIPLSAKTKTSLMNHAKDWLHWSNDTDAQQVVSWLATRRKHYQEERMVVLAESGVDFRSKIDSWLKGKHISDVIYSSNGKKKTTHEVCLVYSGWGQQWFDMGRVLYSTESIFQKAVDDCDAIFKTLTGYSALENFNIFMTKKPSSDEKVIDGDACKPAILFFQIAVTKLLKHYGVEGVSFFGVGLGELSAAHAAGALSFEDTVRLMHVRMSAPPQAEFIKAVDAILKGKSTSSPSFYSAITSEKYSSPLDSAYWWKNVTEKNNVPGTVDHVVSDHPNTIFVEVSGDAVLREPIMIALKGLNASNDVLTTGMKNTNDRTQILNAISWIHVKGVALNWRNITLKCPKYAPIPLYSFDYQQLWLESVNYTTRRSGQLDKSYKACFGKVDVYLQRHLMYYKLDDKQMFPAAGFVEYFSEYDDSKRCFLTNIKFHDSVEVPQLDAMGHYDSIFIHMRQEGVNLKAVHKDKVLAEAQISKGEEDNVSKLFFNLDDIKGRASEMISGDKFFQKFEDLGLQYGVHYNAIERVFIGENEVVGFCNKPHPMNRWERMETVIVESAFQAAIGVFTRGNSLYMPAEIREVQMHVEKVPPHTPFVVYAKLNSWSLESINCDLTIMGTSGHAWVSIRGFVAKNRDEFKTNLPLDRCIYTPRYQTINAQFKQIPEVSLTTDQERMKIQTSLEHLDVVIERRTLVGDESNISLEERAAKELSMALEDQDNSQPVPSAALKEVLRGSVHVLPYISKITSIVKKAVIAALQKKQVLHLCELGSSYGALTRCIVKSLEKEILKGQVEYMLCGKGEDEFKDIDAFLGELPKIKYEKLDDETPLGEHKTLASTFDMVIHFDVTGNFGGRSEELGDLLIDGGMLVAVKSSDRYKLFSFLKGEEHAKTDPSEFSLKGFEGVKSYGEVNDAFTVAIGLKTSSTGTILADKNSSWFIIPNDNADVAKCLSSALTGPSQIMKPNELPDCLEKVSSDTHLNVMLMVSNNKHAWAQAYWTLAALKDHNNCGIMPDLWVVNLGGRSPDAQAAIALSRLAKLENIIKIHIFNIDCNSHDKKMVAQSIIDAMTKAKTGEGEIHISDGRIGVPRLMRLPTFSPQEQEKISMLKSGEVMVMVKSSTQIHDNGHAVFSGLVEAAATDVQGYSAGDAVFGFAKSSSQNIICKASEIRPKPLTISWADSAESLKNYSLAYLGIIEKAKVKTGDTVFCSTPGQALSQAALQIAKLMGARVVAAYSSDADCNKLMKELGSVAFVDPNSLTFQEEIMALTNGKGINAVINTDSNPIPESIQNNLAIKAKICTLGVSNFSSLAAPNIRQMIINYPAYLSTIRGSDRLINAAKAVSDYLESGRLVPLTATATEDAFDGQEECMKHESSIDNYLPEAVMDGNASYVVTGAFGRLGHEVARWLAQRGAKHLVLVAHSKKRNNFDNATIKYLEDSGCKVYIVVADISKKEDVKKIFTELSVGKAPPVKGIFHLAGISSNWLDSTEENISSYLNCQAYGAKYLHEETVDRKFDLTYFVAFTSSLASVGIPQLPSIAASTAYIDGIAEKRHQMGLPGLSFQMGLIRGVGAVSESNDVISVLKDAGMESLHFYEYLRILGNLIQNKNLPAIVTVTNQNWQTLVDQNEDNLWMRHLAEGGLRSESGGGLSKREQYELMAKELISAMTYCPIDTIDSNVAMQTYGVDSLMSQEVITWAEKKLKVTLEQAQVFGGLTIAQLVDMAL